MNMFTVKEMFTDESDKSFKINREDEYLLKSTYVDVNETRANTDWSQLLR